MTREDGFTLTETLIALLVISLSLAGLIAIASLVAHFERGEWMRTRQDKQLTETEAQIAAILHAREPVRGKALTGEAQGFTYACVPASQDSPVCRFSLGASHIPNLHLKYVSQGNMRSDWPPPPEPTDIEAPRLEALILQDGGNRTVGVIRLDADQSQDCQFDMISRICREDAGALTSRATP